MLEMIVKLAGACNQGRRSMTESCTAAYSFAA